MSIRLQQAARYFQSMPHQLAAWNWLEEQLTPAQLQEFAALYRAAPTPKEPLVSPAPATTPSLKVPYYSQRDSTLVGQAQRMCFSSSCAMLLSYLRPGAITGPNADDKYLATLRQYGDTTDAGAQLKTLASFGVQAKFVQSASWADLKRQIARKVPVPCGFLHHGSSSHPSGGGHWLTVIGVTDSAAIVNDPWGEMNVQLGTYRNTNGASLRYPRELWEPRWCVEGPSSGWAIIAEP